MSTTDHKFHMEQSVAERLAEVSLSDSLSDPGSYTKPGEIRVSGIAKRVAPLSDTDRALLDERVAGKDAVAKRPFCESPPPSSVLRPIGTHDALARFETLINDDAAQERIAASLERRQEDWHSKCADRFRRRQQARWREIPACYREPFDMTLTKLPFEVVAQVRRWNPTDPKGIGLVGGTGLGKTRLLVGEVIRRLTCSWVFIPATRFAAATREQWNDDYGIAHRAEEVLEGSRRARVLMLDDVGQESPTEGVLEALFDMIEYRTSRKMPILWTCNLSGDDLAERHKTRGAALVRRLREFSWTP